MNEDELLELAREAFATRDVARAVKAIPSIGGTRSYPQ
jgi:hypothetical protein